MGAIADALVAYAQPLLDATDGSQAELEKAFSLTQLCYNLALTPADLRDEAISQMQQSIGLNDEDFEDFRQNVLNTMIQRHEDMFPQMHGRAPTSRYRPAPSWLAPQAAANPVEKRPVSEPYAPCPCNSGKKFKFCCGMKRR